MYLQASFGSGNYAYTAGTTNGLVIVAISNPSSPTSAVTYNTQGDAEGIYI